MTRGLLRRLEPAEVEVVLAHELSHVLHRDVQVMVMATFFSTVASFIVQTGILGESALNPGAATAVGPSPS